MKLLYGCSALVQDFVAQRIEDCQRGFGMAVAVGVINDEDRLIAGMVFHNWNPEAGLIEISSASDDRRWLTANVRHAMFSYPFDQIGCQMVFLRVAADNRPMVRIAKAYGFKPNLIERLFGRDRDGFIFTLTDDAWRSSRFYTKEQAHG